MTVAKQAIKTPLKPDDYKSGLKPVWCPGCGNYGVLNALCQVFHRLGLKPKETMIFSGIGCSSRIPGYLNSYGFNSVHGRVLPIAIGAKLANPKLNVIAAGGDGDAFSIGIGHFPHACRRNIDMTYIVMDNNVYGLTKGQLSPTSPREMLTTTSRFGSIETPINPITLAICCQATFVARAFSGDIKHMVEVITKGIEHKGFSFIQVLSPCVTYVGKEQFLIIKNLLHYLDEDLDYDPGHRSSAFQVADEKKQISVGIVYQKSKPTYYDKLEDLRRKAASKKKERLVELVEIFRP